MLVVNAVSWRWLRQKYKEVTWKHANTHRPDWYTSCLTCEGTQGGCHFSRAVRGDFGTAWYQWQQQQQQL
jgi:hypothetical protein